MIDDFELENNQSESNLKDDLDNIKCGFISESDVENDELKSKYASSKQKEDTKNYKNFTSKIFSFIKKLRNENNTDDMGQTGDEEDAEDYEEGWQTDYR